MLIIDCPLCKPFYGSWCRELCLIVQVNFEETFYILII